MSKVVGKLIGLTGGIGSGKSTIAQMIRDRGIPVIDADALAREVVEPGQPAYADIAAAWPAVIAADGRIDRKRLGDVVFADARAKARLEAMTHPRIRALVAARVAELAAAGHSLIFLEAALLVESGMHRELDGLVVVAASEATQVARVMARDGLSHGRALARLRAQQPLDEKIRVANYVIRNDGSLDDTRRQVAEVLVAMAKP